MPATMATIGVIGGAVSAYGQYSQGIEEQKAQEYNAALNEREAGLITAGAEREASIISQNAVLNEYRQRKQQQAVTGQQMGAYAGRGVSVGTGSPLDVMADSIANSELEIEIAKWSAQNEIAVTKYNAEVGAGRKRSEAEMRRRYGASAATTGTLKGIGTLLSSSGTAYDRLSKEKIGG